MNLFIDRTQIYIIWYKFHSALGFGGNWVALDSKFLIIQLGNKPSNPLPISSFPHLLNRPFKSETDYRVTEGLI